jgi:hypothetical protein
MRAAVLFAGVLGCSNQATAPTGFGVNVTVDAAQLGSGDRGRVQTASLTVTGDEPFTSSFDVHGPIQSGRVRFHYIPLIRSGTLSFVIEVKDTGGVVVASGGSAVTTLVDNHAVEALITLTLGGVVDLGTANPDEGSGDASATQLGNGTACSAASDCESGFCVDGVCCETACTQACHTCGLAGAPGVCNLAFSGSDPHNNCSDDGTPCGLDGTCDGAGGCRFRTTDVVCRAQHCDIASGMLSSAATCDGKGACPASTVADCTPYVCKSDSSDCFNDCQPDGGSVECDAPKTCTSGSCGPKPLGRGCGGDSECQTGMCRDGVCCATDCNTPCFACNLAGKLGTCSPTANGAAARAGSCTNPTADPCGSNGTCDGSGKCKFPSGNLCANGTCSSGDAHKGKRCDGAGTCAPVSSSTVQCDPYRCYTSASGSFNEAYCYTSCGNCNGFCVIGQPCPILNDSNCASGKTCTNNCSTTNRIICK